MDYNRFWCVTWTWALHVAYHTSLTLTNLIYLQHSVITHGKWQAFSKGSPFKYEYDQQQVQKSNRWGNAPTYWEYGGHTHTHTHTHTKSVDLHQILMGLSVAIQVLWDVTPCGWVCGSRCSAKSVLHTSSRVKRVTGAHICPSHTFPNGYHCTGHSCNGNTIHKYLPEPPRLWYSSWNSWPLTREIQRSFEPSGNTQLT
jgi:hypothetical protein